MSYCERCAVEGAMVSARTVRLIGDFQATLCNICLNDHSEYVESLPEWAELQSLWADKDIQRLRAMSGIAPDPHYVRELHRRCRALMARFREIAREFMISSVGEQTIETSSVEEQALHDIIG